ncbi:MAG: ATP phosphoribosyltransferase regulatory subunit [Lachnospiraceae bacterium]|nr:ATP phosphoribosyltransferase regulatory subunit [Lachnospiraceae bacterium]
MKKLIHTPEGVRDIYGSELHSKLWVKQQISDVFHTFGYEDIQTPTFEFFDVFGSDIGTTPSKELYKFFDKEGNTLVLRPDLTPGVVRAASKYFVEDEAAIRLCYEGETYTNTSNLQGKLKEVTQMGVEFIGDGSVYADAEIVHLAVSALKASGLKEFTVSVGDVSFFKGICQEAKLSEETEDELREYISDKNLFGVEEVLQEKNISKENTDAFLRITELFGSAEVLEEAQELVHNDVSRAAIARLKEFYNLICFYGDEKYVSFDLGLVSRYHYYTGMIFKGYTYGTGDAILLGGRYDQLVSYFGKEAPAVGCMVVLDGLLQALASRELLQSYDQDVTYAVFAKEDTKLALQFVNQARALGDRMAVFVLDEKRNEAYYKKLGEKHHAKEVLKIDAKGAKKL